MVNHYPLLFTPVFKKMIWGSESWDITCRRDEMGIIKNGHAAGITFADYIAKDPIGTLGTRIAANGDFPLLVKIIDARDTLSVQVHPDDGYGEESGKSEMWYIITPPTGGELIIGLKPGITAQILRDAYENNSVEECLDRLRVKAGDIINIPAGLVHALTPGAKLAEVQQNSDTTYRIYDYNRLSPDGKPRQLHVGDALAVTDFTGKIPKTTVPGLDIKKDNCIYTYAIANKHFAIIKYELSGKIQETSNPAAFSIFTCVEGEVEIMGVQLQAEQSVFIPAALGTYTIKPSKTCTLLKAYTPIIKTDFIKPLMDYGYSHKEITSKCAIEIDSLQNPPYNTPA